MYKEFGLKDEFNRSIGYNELYLEYFINDLNDFILNNSFMNEYDFAKKKLMSFEIKNNNNIEGIKDDILTIEKAVNKNEYKNIKRIHNLFEGYKYILLNKEINKENLRELYRILSDELLEEKYKNNMDYYRKGPVYILRGNNLCLEPFNGMDHNRLNYFMDMFFDYVNSNNDLDSINLFIKSQIMHYYFVYVHPYFDVNGRTSRTVSLWYLLNNKSYPYVIFNDAISFCKNKYEKSIILSRSKSNITAFLEFMLIQVKKELEKEAIINSIIINTDEKLTNDEIEIINYILTMNGNITVKDISWFYNQFNNKKPPVFISNNLINKMIDKNILLFKGYTKSYVDKDNLNYKLELNKDNIKVDSDRIKYIKNDKYM